MSVERLQVEAKASTAASLNRILGIKVAFEDFRMIHGNTKFCRI